MTTDAQCKQETTGSQETADDIRKSLSRRALEYSRFGHESACQDWRDLKTKLRGLAGISGIFIGGIAALAGNNRIGELARSPLIAVVVVLAILALALGIVFALRGLRVRDLEVPRPAREFLEDAVAIGRDSNDDVACLRARAREWTAKATMQYAVSEESIRTVNATKAEQVARAETCLLIGACLGAIVLIVVAGGPLWAEHHVSSPGACRIRNLRSPRTDCGSPESSAGWRDLSRAWASAE